MNNTELSNDRCFHCTETVEQPSKWRITFRNQEHSVCCAGCEAIANTILAAGLDDYYLFRTEPAHYGQLPQAVTNKLDELIGWDAPEISMRYLNPIENGDCNYLHELTLSVEGLRCGACVWLLERTLLNLTGVKQVRVNLCTERAHVVFNSEVTTLSSIIKKGIDIGYTLQPYDIAAKEISDTRLMQQERQRLFVAALGSMQVMMYALPAYLTPDVEIEQQYINLLRWASLILTLPVVFYSALPFFRAAYRDILMRAPGMDVPVALALSIAFGASVFNTVQLKGDVWFDSVSMFVFLLLGARMLESTARRHARKAMDTLGSTLPDTTTRLPSKTAEADEREQVPVSRLTKGDLVYVAAGERIPADCIFCGVAGLVDLSMLTGESTPVKIIKGDEIPAGALVAESPMVLEVSRKASQSALSLLVQLVERSAEQRPPAALLAEKVAKHFVSLLLVLVSAVFVIWWHIEPSRASQIAIATLIVSCPCALSMAIPTALAATTARLIQQKLLITKPHALEKAATITDIVFDKTGTLTQGKPQVKALLLFNATSPQDALGIASELEAGSAHPFARAIQQFARKKLSDSSASNKKLTHINHTTGQGIQGSDDEHEWFLGTPEFCKLDKSTLLLSRQKSHNDNPHSCSEVWLSRRRLSKNENPKYIAHFLIHDPIREDTAEVIKQLKKQGYKLHLLSGDQQSVVKDVARQLDITHIKAGQSPESKCKEVIAMQASGARVLMVGDGLNDAPVMAAADVSLTIGEASDLTKSTSDAVSLTAQSSSSRGGLTAVLQFTKAAKETRKIMRQNLSWAVSYNLVMIPLTALGEIPPWIAALGMATSSLIVCANALRLYSTNNREIQLPNTPPSIQESGCYTLSALER